MTTTLRVAVRQTVRSTARDLVDGRLVLHDDVVAAAKLLAAMRPWLPDLEHGPLAGLPPTLV